MPGDYWTGITDFGLQRQARSQEPLDRALIAGLLLEVSLNLPAFPSDPRVRRHFLKTRLEDCLVSHLAGRVTLDRFRDLARGLEKWFIFYYPLVAGLQGLPDLPPPSLSQVEDERLKIWFDQHRHLFPRRRQRKLTTPGLRDFLERTQGTRFTLQEFGQYFGIGRKTAWEYLQRFVRAALLTHNGARSSRVRYSLAPEFLRLRSP